MGKHIEGETSSRLWQTEWWEKRERLEKKRKEVIWPRRLRWYASHSRWQIYRSFLGDRWRETKLGPRLSRSLPWRSVMVAVEVMCVRECLARDQGSVNMAVELCQLNMGVGREEKRERKREKGRRGGGRGDEEKRGRLLPLFFVDERRNWILYSHSRFLSWWWALKC